MLPRLATRVFPRAYASLTSGLLASANARQQIATRTFLTTATVATPATKATKTTKTTKASKASKVSKASEASETEPAPKKTRRSSAEVQAERAAKEKAKAKAARAKAKALKLLTDPELRLKAPLKLIKIKQSEQPPKYASSAYNLFVKEHFANLRAETKTDGDAPYAKVFSALSKQLSERWNNLSEEERKPYLEKEQQAKDQYEADVAEWYKTTDPRIVLAVRAQKLRSPALPAQLKRPLPPYIQFHTENTHTIEVPEGTPRSEAIAYRGRRMGALWRALPEEEKKRRKEEYLKEMEEYRERVKQLQEDLKA